MESSGQSSEVLSLCVEDVVSDVQKTMEYAEGCVRQQAEEKISKVELAEIIIVRLCV